MRRPTGSGTIEKHGDRFRARMPDTKRSVMGIFATFAEAEKALNAWISATEAPRGDSILTYGADWLVRRARVRPKSIDQDMARWRAYVEPWECAAWPLKEVRRGDVRRWVDGLQAKGLADQTVRNALNLVRVCLHGALDDEFIMVNPAVGVRVHPKGHVEDTWAYLKPDEQLQLLRAMPLHQRAMAGFAIGTGLRWSEQRMLELTDVHLEEDKPYVYVRRSARGSPKNARHRRVPLFNLGLDAARVLVGLVEHRRNPRGLLCLPPRSEAYRSKHGPRLARALKRAGLDRHVRWHDLRHTCASSLVAGWWGRAWALIEVRDFMGHKTLAITERYAHLAGSVVENAALETRRHDGAISDVFKPVTMGSLSAMSDGPDGFVNRRSGVRIPKVAPQLTELTSGAAMAPTGAAEEAAVLLSAPAPPELLAWALRSALDRAAARGGSHV